MSLSGITSFYSHMHCKGSVWYGMVWYGMVWSRLPQSLEKVVPILVLQIENDPIFCGKALTFQLKTTPFSR